MHSFWGSFVDGHTDDHLPQSLSSQSVFMRVQGESKQSGGVEKQPGGVEYYSGLLTNDIKVTVTS